MATKIGFCKCLDTGTHDCTNVLEDEHTVRAYGVNVQQSTWRKRDAVMTKRAYHSVSRKISGTFTLNGLSEPQYNR